jgi:serine/threonine-protein kinase
LTASSPPVNYRIVYNPRTVSTLLSGTRVGAYEVLSALGAGGMGQVYRARDTKLGRDVALKLLPPAFAHDPERIGRFRREAQVLAALNHPHIAAIHGVEELDGAQVLVLELVDGETLAARLQRGALPLDEALAIARQIADALGAAHDKGIIHRDLKPANIALTAQDRVKVLDFGLARALEATDGSDASKSPTLTFQATQAGVILGTAAYMSPEQAKGRAADKRADVWAFGCVLYEMLTGRRVFEGEDVSDTMAAVLRADPDWSALPALTPPAVRTLIQQCLVRDRHARIADIAVAAYVLRAPSDSAKPTPQPAPPTRALRWLAIAIAPALLLAAAIGWLARRPPTVPPQMTRFNVTVPSDQTIVEAVRRRRLLALSPDGSRLAYVANDQIYLRPMDAIEAAPIRGSHEQPAEIAFSPDGEWIVYWVGPRLKKLPVGGGVSVTLAEVPGLLGMSWSGERILIASGRQIVEVPATGGTPKVLVDNRDRGGLIELPQLLPGGRRILYTLLSGRVLGDASSASTADIIVETIATGERKTLVRGGIDGRYLPTGHLLYARDGVLLAQAIDIDRLELKGGFAVLVDGVATSAGPTFNAQYAVADNGTLAYLPRAVSSAATLAWRNPQGVETPISAPPHAYDQPRISPDGRRIAVHATDQDNDIWVWDIGSETLTRLTFDRSTDSFHVWLRDSARIAYMSSTGEPNLFVRAADGTGQPEALLKKAPESSGALVTNGTAPDGKSLIFSVGVPSDIMLLPLDGSGAAKPLLANPLYAERSGQISPDGRWLAYQSDESGIFQVYVRPFPHVDQGRWQVSTDGGSVPLWHPNGRELFYIDTADHVLGVPVQAAASFAFGKPSLAFDFSDRPAASPYRNYDIGPDGRFVVVKETQRGRASLQFVVRLNWFEDVKARLPGR